MIVGDSDDGRYSAVERKGSCLGEGCSEKLKCEARALCDTRPRYWSCVEQNATSFGKTMKEGQD